MMIFTFNNIILLMCIGIKTLRSNAFLVKKLMKFMRHIFPTWFKPLHINTWRKLSSNIRNISLKYIKYLRFRTKKRNLGIFVVIIDECNKVFIIRTRYNWRNTSYVTMKQIKIFFSTSAMRRKGKTRTLT
jgi:hypothetical protein